MMRKCGVCDLGEAQLKEIVRMHLDGTPTRQIAGHFPVSHSSIHRHLRNCVAVDVIRAKESGHIALDWKSILDELATVSNLLAETAKAAVASGDHHAAFESTKLFIDEIAKRAKLAEAMSTGTHNDLASALARIAGAYVMDYPRAAPQTIADILSRHPAACAVLESLQEKDQAA